MDTRAKFKCDSIVDYGEEFQDVNLVAVEDEENQFVISKMTIKIAKHESIGYFRPGKEYFMGFTEVENKGQRATIN